ncbi:nicotinate phosphoribosyltransferase [Peptostreptococcus anaerobius]|uniref:nicotinate phosphoribosyltransferase n=1 Tax=Peptostreptococcus anaerobius TaxID=1261 RepID=UPI00232E6BB6|nr:nicotinate phosphoribosyltransferase [Peptostreptococcus anaerobius]MDB8821014.1 nicotinate phosphoribosyltransferase [Peptostreptococcus anaerobius]MDB8825492.1 nicotinate phosphoribosyltransferase [Peptostreptococcus anaerobius]MDB8827582.1 nicotinate phosphoribosyltransferase [Peptostreptococcus anaerobius]MDB8829399.1 nicotinate phosphoribosyltransferase [Peptostreptococcus anaerobius]MDB8831178.1 nicotinate phosphoribosyltransferase [Peptostreptococcus anaerobius]
MKTNLTMLTDLYQLTMMNGYYKKGVENDTAVFDVFFRKNVCEGGYTIVCGIEEIVHYINNLSFNEHDLDYLRSLNLFDEDFIGFLRDFKFTGDIYAVEDGSVMFPGEPIIVVKAPLYQAQLVETAILSIVNFMTLIATKASRVCNAAGGDPVLEFGLRRAQGPEAGLYGAKAAIIGGCTGTSNVLTGKMFGVPVAGTHAHSWVQKFDSELEAFRAYAQTYPDSCLLLIDTYNVLESGIKNALIVFDELRAKGFEPIGVRLDSGDLTYLSKEVRKILDDAGYPNAKITASNDLDEYTIISLKQEGAAIDSWGVGTKLITSYDYPSLGGVYKLAATTNREGILEPKIKISENPEKINNPGFKKVVRIYNNNEKCEADLIMLDDETIDETKPLEIFDPVYTWKRRVYENYTIRELLKPLFLEGKLVRERKSVYEVKEYAKKELSSMWDQYKRIKNPHIYKVDLSQKLWDMKNDLIASKR